MVDYDDPRPDEDKDKKSVGILHLEEVLTTIWISGIAFIHLSKRPVGKSATSGTERNRYA